MARSTITNVHMINGIVKYEDLKST